MTDTNGPLDLDGVRRRFRQACERRRPWEGHWRDCYEFALPQRDGSLGGGSPGEKRTDRLFDGTAPDAVEQLAASLLAELTPPWARWFNLAAGIEATDAERDVLAAVLDQAGAVLQHHFDRSNFAVEMHQAYLDLVTGGTASLLFEEALVGEESAFRFTAVPLAELVLEEGADGRLDVTYRRHEMTIEQIKARFPQARLPDALTRDGEAEARRRHAVIEAVLPDARGYRYAALLETSDNAADGLLAEGRFAASPFLNFRWLKAPGEVYGRSPVMKALPDIKTANKVVELVLKNASIAVTGIWQADDDGVLNPATIRLAPGTIIPKAVGSAGLTPLEAPGRFDVSQLVLDDLRARIRHALLADRLGQVEGPKMTATEVLERSAEMARILGATFGRLQAELLTPLVARALAILQRRGEIHDLAIDGRLIELQYRSPLARQQQRQEAQNTLAWLGAVQGLGSSAAGVIDSVATARWLGKAFGVPGELLRSAATPPADGALAGLVQAVEMLTGGAPSEQEAVDAGG